MPAASTSLSRLLFLFLQWPLAVVMKQTRQVVHAFKQSILLLVEHLSRTQAVQQSLTKFVTITAKNLVAPGAAAKLELLFNKLASAV